MGWILNLVPSVSRTIPVGAKTSGTTFGPSERNYRGHRSLRWVGVKRTGNPDRGSTCKTCVKSGKSVNRLAPDLSLGVSQRPGGLEPWDSFLASRAERKEANQINLQYPRPPFSRPPSAAPQGEGHLGSRGRGPASRGECRGPQVHAPQITDKLEGTF